MNFVEEPKKGEIVYYLGGDKPYLVLILGPSYGTTSSKDSEASFERYSWVRILPDGSLGVQEEGEGFFGCFDDEYEVVARVIFKRRRR